MGRKMYIGVDSKARKVKKVFIGVDNKARKVKKMYMGVEGKARCIFGGGELSYYGKAAPLDLARDGACSANVGDYVLIAGGSTGSASASPRVDAYNKSLTHSIIVQLGVGVYSFAGASIKNDYACFAGGSKRTDMNSPTDYVNFYDKSLTRSTKYLNWYRVGLSGASVGNYVVFAGGETYNSSGVSNDYNLQVDTFDSSLTHGYFPDLSSRMTFQKAGSIGDYAVFGGANIIYDGGGLVNAYNSSGVRFVPEKSYQTSNAGCATTKTHLIFACEYNKNFGNDAYDKSLTHSTVAQLSPNRYYATGASSEEYAFFAGSLSSSSDYGGDTVNVYDLSLTMTTTTPLSEFKSRMTGCSIGNYVLFAGGTKNSSYTKVADVDVYQVA